MKTVRSDVHLVAIDEETRREEKTSHWNRWFLSSRDISQASFSNALISICQNAPMMLTTGNIPGKDLWRKGLDSSLEKH